MRLTRAQAAAQAAAATADPQPQGQDDASSQGRPPLGELPANGDMDDQNGAKGVVAEKGRAELDPSRDQEAQREADAYVDTDADIPIHLDDHTEPKLDAAPPRTPAKILMTKEASHMRSTSNKENVIPNSPLSQTPTQSNISVQQAAESQPPTAETEGQPATTETESQSANTEVDNHAEPSQTEIEPEIHPDLDSSNLPEAASELEPTSRLDSEGQPLVQPETQPEAQPTVQSETKVHAQSNNLAVQEDTTQQQEVKPPSESDAGVTQVLEPEVQEVNREKPNSKGVSSTIVKKPSSSVSRPEAKEQPRKSTLVRSSSVRQSTVPKSEPAASAAIRRTTSVKRPSARPSVASRQPPSDDQSSQPERASANIPHSKPRPMSMSFPTPKMPNKSTKPPTKSTFQLPGEAIAAKLKAAKEARLKKEEEEKLTKPPAFKARPAPKLKDSGAVVRQTALSRARLLGKDAPDAKSNTTNGLKRASSVRDSMLKDTKSTSAATKRLSTITTTSAATQRHSALINGPGMSIAPPRTSTVAVHKRTMSTPAAAVKPHTASGTTVAPAQRVPSNGTKKGKEVFQRAAAEKETLEKQRREKEEAAKKARVDAAEKSRVASREWAAKMKQKASLKKAHTGKENTAAVAPVA